MPDFPISSFSIKEVASSASSVCFPAKAPCLQLAGWASLLIPPQSPGDFKAQPCGGFMLPLSQGISGSAAYYCEISSLSLASVSVSIKQGQPI